MFTALICKHKKLGLLYIRDYCRLSEQIRVNIAPETLNFPRIQNGDAVLQLNVFVVSPDSTGAKNLSFEVSSLNLGSIFSTQATCCLVL